MVDDAGDPDLTPAELRAIVAVARHGSFSAAATDLGLTQSAVSHSIGGTERKIGAVLFVRGRTGAQATPAGLRAVAHARAVLRLLSALPADARAAAGGELAGRIRVAAFRSAASHLLPPVLSRLALRHPGVSYDVAVVRDVGAGAAGELVAGRADLAIVNLPHRLPTDTGLVSGPLLREPYVLLHPAGSADTERLPLINWVENCSAPTRRWFAAQSWMPPATITVADDSVLLSMIAHGMGMAVVPRLTALALPAGVTARDLGADAPSQTVGYLTTTDLARTLAVRELIRELRTHRAVLPRPLAG